MTQQPDKRATELRALYVNNIDNNSNANGNNNLNNNARFLLIIQAETHKMDLFEKLVSYDNLILAHRKARKHKTLKPYVIEFEKKLQENLLRLQYELITKKYTPRPLETFIIRDPKTRKISRSDFRDRVVHHALCNIIESIFEKIFIYDSYANRICKGTLKAIERYCQFQRKTSKNNTKRIYILKADIKRYFDNVNHKILMEIIKEKITDEKMLWLIRIILENHHTSINEKSMPLGNLTSQFFANVYLNKLDQYIKHDLKIRYYIRYVDDFVIMCDSKKELEMLAEKINTFLKERLDIALHPEKTKIYAVKEGGEFLGLRIFYFHKLLKRCNIRKFKNKLSRLCKLYDKKEADYDEIYGFLEGWIAYSKTANTYNLRNNLLEPICSRFDGEVSTKEYNRHLKPRNKPESSIFQSSIFPFRMRRFIKIIVHLKSSFARCGRTEKLKEPILSRNKTLR